MKGASWADATAAEEEELDRRAEQARQQRDSARSSAGAGAGPQSSPRGGGASGAGGYGGRSSGGYNDSQSQGGYARQDSRGGQDSRGPGGYGEQRSSGYDNRRSDNRDAPMQRQSRDARDARDSRAGGGQWNRGEQPSGYGRDDRRGGGGDDRRDNSFGRGGGGGGDYARGGGAGRGGGRGGLKPSEDLSDSTEQGIIGTLKDASQFGFIQCADRDGEMFFHYSDVAGGAPRRGDEVEFRIVTDSRDGRTRAVQVEVLPRGSVQMERVLEENVRGVVTKEMLGQFKPDRRGRGPKATLAESLAQGRPEAYGGKVKRVEAAADAEAAGASGAAAPAAAAAESAAAPAASTSTDLYEFSERDLVDANVVLYVGDVVSFSIFEERRSRRRGATKLQLVEPNPAGRERGTVVSVKDNFGFVQLEQQFDEDDDAPPQSQHGGRGGWKEQQLFFHFSELMDPRRLPNVGDELSFRVDKSPAVGGEQSNKLSAQRIFMLPKGSLNSREVGRETLQGTVIKEITFETAQQQQQQAAAAAAAAAAASPSPEAPAPSASPVPGDVPNPLARDTPAPNERSTRGARKVVPGLISWTDETGATVELAFRPNDVSGGQNRGAAPAVLKGDTASFHLLTLRTRNGTTRRATQVSVSPAGWGAASREQGVVTAVKDGGFAFVDSNARSDKIFLHATQLQQAVAASRKDENPRERRQQGGDQLTVGLEVEFNCVQTEPGKFAAMRVAVLPAGTVQFDELLPYTLTGTVARGVKVRDAKAAASAPKDSASFSKNDVRREQADQPQGGRVSKGDKGEIKNLSFSGDVVPQSGAEFPLPKEGVQFYDVDVLAPAVANLDTTALVAGDVVTLQLKRHKVSKKLSGASVQLQQMNPTQREKGRVTQLRERDGLGFLSVASRAAPLAFFLKDAPRSGGAAVTVGDCFEFSVVDAPSKKDAARSAGRSGADEPAAAFAVRLAALPRDAVPDVEQVDRTRKLRGFISQMPEKPGKDGKGAKKAGVVVVLPTERAVPVPNAALTHPGSWSLDASAAWATYSAAGIHAASIAPEAPKSEGEEKYSFTLRDLSLTSFVSKGDLLDFYLSVRTLPAVTKRAVEFSLVPLQGTIDKVEADKSSADKAYSGTLTVYNPQAQRSEEVFLFSSRDVLAEAGAPPLVPGDFVEFAGIALNEQQKKRVALKITRAKDSRPAELRPSVAKRKVGAPIIVASRFARGPDATGIGFAPRRARTQASPSPSPSPA